MSTIEQRFENIKKSKTFNNIVMLFQLDKKSVLDIGCSYGEFLVCFGSGSVGLTITEDEVQYGKSKGYDIRYGNIESSEFKMEEKFDVIFANNIFEHLFSPHYFLYKTRKMLKPNGFLILGVPCIPKITFLLHLNKFRGSLAGPHINFFTRDTFVKTVERGGLRVIDTRGYHFTNRFVDKLLDSIYPHFYVIATPIPNFQYPEKRMGKLIDNLVFKFK